VTPLLLFLALFAQAEKLPEGPGKATVLKACGGCHAPEAVIGTNNTKRGWTELVDEMISKGAVANARERREIIAYLVRNFPMRRQ
jgi:mono/diheme cytochrome c family protein